MAQTPKRIVYQGRLVTMAGKVVDDGRLLVENDRIVAVGAGGATRPGWQAAPVIDTKGTIYPGLVDLHGHLPYNVLPPWQVPKRFCNRSQWLDRPDYKRDIAQPMQTLMNRGTPVARAIVRYVEVKLLLGGTTVAQGLRSWRGVGKQLYSGLVRNVEAPDEAGLALADTRVPDLTPAEVETMRKNLADGKPYIFHLAEGKDDRARAQFRLLRDEKLLRDNLVCIHCVGLSAEDHELLRRHDVGTVWSPLSNLLLYGRTLDPEALTGPFALGCDWTPSGSRNLLHEIKVAHLHAREMGWTLSAESLARSVTVDAARAVQWQTHLGTLEENKLADLLVLDTRHDDVYENLLAATERNVRLVVIDGEPRHGDSALMTKLLPGVACEPIEVGGRKKLLNLDQPGSELDGLSLEQATSLLQAAMNDLGSTAPLRLASAARLDEEPFTIELDMQGSATTADFEVARALPRLTSVPLDKLTVVDDPGHFDALDRQINLPAHLKGSGGLRQFYA